ncbi:MAG TPA: complex I NDUFA9 subunit family protein [Gemmatimonadaceae bacterium]|nr:complex I NDUFA9 subunit family protein [Gemmatimonadaceae bacterium]
MEQKRHADAPATTAAMAEEERPETEAWRGSRTVLVTGASGLVGTHSCRELARRGWQVRALVRNRAKAHRRLAISGVEIVVGDVRDGRAMAEAVSEADAVVHLAAIAMERRGESYESVNRDATTTLLDAMRARGVERLVYMSQNGASSDSPYRFLRSKGVAEDQVRASGLAWTIFRPSVIFGPEDEFVNVLARLVRLSPLVYPLPGGGSARFQPVSVDDVARAMGAALDESSAQHATFALGGPEALTLRQMVRRVLVAMRTKRLLVGVPVWLIRPLVAVAQRVLPNPPVTTSLLDLLSLDNTIADQSAWPALGISPTSFTPHNLAYLRNITVGDALESLLR